MEIHNLMFIGLATVAATGVAYVLIYPLLSGEAAAEKRKATFISSRSTRKSSDKQSADGAARRKQIADSLKEIETRNKRKKISLEGQMVHAGLNWSRRQFIIYSVLSGAVLGILMFIVEKNPFVALGAAIVGGIGLPRWFVHFAGKRRIRKFVDDFPDAIDIIVRGVRAGLPLNDCLNIIAHESSEPLRTEFRLIVESQAMGLTVSEAVERLITRVPVAEASFFAIVISIQHKAGGNLSEALANLAAVLRDRKKMKGKIAALSSEATASAAIIGALPFIVGVLVYITSPSYIRLLWTTTTGQISMVCAAIWMAIGILVMKKMVSFEI